MMRPLTLPPTFGGRERKAFLAMPTRQEVKRTAKRTLLAALLGWVLALTGSVVPDGRLPRLNPIATTHAAAIQHNSTDALRMALNRGAKLTHERWWADLQPTLSLVRAMSSEIADWAERLYGEKRIRFNPEDMPGQNLCHYDMWSDTLSISGSLLGLPDGDKAAAIVHEYRHARQNKWKWLADAVTPRRLWITYIDMCRGADSGRNYGNPLEDEAHAYERDAYLAMGLSPASAEEYFATYGRTRPWAPSED